MPPKLPAALRARVRIRARFLCEYCHTDETWQYVPFTVDHVFPSSLGGLDTFYNLALACFHCNRRKSNLRMAFDGQSGRVVPLFNPRKHRWKDHFIWSRNRLLIIPLTPTGRVTVKQFDLNRDRIQQIRSADASIGRHPPLNDTVQTVEVQSPPSEEQ